MRGREYKSNSAVGSGSHPVSEPQSARRLASSAPVPEQRLRGNAFMQRAVRLARQQNGPAEAGQNVENSIESRRGGGQPLDSSVRRQMEGSFGADFSDVRVHQDGEADSLNRSLEARAFTTGPDIFFSHNTYQPGTSAGRELLAHELTHVVQQTGRVQASMSVSQPGDVYEEEAERVASSVMREETAEPAPKQDDEDERAQTSVMRETAEQTTKEDEEA
jgi:hypothetical protein